jgi:hypothetical protein
LVGFDFKRQGFGLNQADRETDEAEQDNQYLHEVSAHDSFSKWPQAAIPFISSTFG